MLENEVMCESISRSLQSNGAICDTTVLPLQQMTLFAACSNDRKSSLAHFVVGSQISGSDAKVFIQS